MTLQQFLLVLWARRRQVFQTFVVTVLTTLVVSLLWPKEYTATTAVVVDVKSPDPVAGIVLPGLMAPGYMATQVDIITSDRVTMRVVKMLKLDENPSIREQWQSDTNGEGQIMPWLVTLLQKKLDVKPSRESNLININYSGASPEFAATMANAFAQAYVDVNLDLRVEPARQSAQWFDIQTRQYRERLDKAQAALSAQQQKSGIVATDERLDYETQKLNELSTQLTIAQAQGADSTSKRKGGSADTMPEVMQSTLVNQLKAEIAIREARLKELSGNLGENHPQYLRTAAELAELKAKVSSEIGRINSSIGTAGSISKQKEAELITAVNAQKTKILELKKQRDEVSLLVREVESAQRAYDAVSQRSTQARLESQSIQTNVSILNPAIEPIDPSRPRLLLNMAISIVLGGLLGVGTALALELGNRRVRSAEDIIEVLDLPVLASISSTLPPATLMQTIKSLFQLRRRKAAV